MRGVFLCLAVIILAMPAYAQTDNAPSQPAVGAPRRSAVVHGNTRPAKGSRYKPEIPVSAPIITLDGVCSQPATKSTAKPATQCKTVLTRGQLEALLDSIEPDASPRSRSQFALSYARLLAASQIAERKHLDKDPSVIREIQVQQQLARMEVLSDALVQGFRKNAGRVPTEDVEAYYKQYRSSFEQADVHRLAIPLNAATESGKPVEAAVAKARMEELRTRALAGEDFNDLQAAAYKDLGIKSSLPPTDIGVMRRTSLSPEEARVFEVEAGQPTEVFENQGIIMILRTGTRRTLPLDEARPLIEPMLIHQRMVEELHDSTKGISAEFNLKYLDTQTQPELFPPTILGQGALRRGMLSSLHVQP